MLELCLVRFGIWHVWCVGGGGSDNIKVIIYFTVFKLKLKSDMSLAKVEKVKEKVVEVKRVRYVEKNTKRRRCKSFEFSRYSFLFLS